MGLHELRMLSLLIKEDIYLMSTLFTGIYRDPPEATGEEGEDFDFSAPKIYEPVSRSVAIKF